MPIDLTPQAGFPLTFDPTTLRVSTSAGVRFNRETRRVDSLREVLYRPDALPPETELYWNYSLAHAGPVDSLFRDSHLTLGLVLLPSLSVGSEYVKTHGHYHSPMPGGQFDYPEVYTHYFGKLYLYMQKRAPGSDASLEDCVLYAMRPGESITVPPGYAHILINPSGEAALMAGLYSPDAVHDYAPIRRFRGAAYTFIRGASLERAIKNPNYASVPPLRILRDLAGTAFFPPDSHRPLWTSFVDDPRRYAFIVDPAAARSFFGIEEPAV